MISMVRYDVMGSQVVGRGESDRVSAALLSSFVRRVV